jgi:hypothetical protein
MGRVQAKLKAMSLARLNHRTESARFVREAIAAFTADLGGPAELSEAERQIVEHAAILRLFVQDFTTKALTGESPMFAGEKVSFADVIRCIGEHKSLLMQIGLKRRARTDPRIMEIIARHDKNEEAA